LDGYRLLLPGREDTIAIFLQTPPFGSNQDIREVLLLLVEQSILNPLQMFIYK
jgi:hypothetical protein